MKNKVLKLFKVKTKLYTPYYVITHSMDDAYERACKYILNNVDYARSDDIELECVEVIAADTGTYPKLLLPEGILDKDGEIAEPYRDLSVMWCGRPCIKGKSLQDGDPTPDSPIKIENMPNQG